MDEVLFDVSEGVATVILNRPERRNGLNPAVLAELEAIVQHVRDDRSVRVLILTGAGRKPPSVPICQTSARESSNFSARKRDWQPFRKRKR